MPIGKSKKSFLIFTESKHFKKYVPHLEKVLELSLTYLKCKSTFVNVYLISDISMTEMNKRFKKKSGSASVLSFPSAEYFFPHPEFSSRIHFLGDIFLAPHYIIRDKKEPLKRFLVHGILHLLGYTHAKRYDRIEMEKLEEKIDEYLMQYLSKLED